MDPRDVDSAADVRAGWADWDYGERLDALAALANANLDKYGYDDVDVYNTEVDGEGRAQYSDDEIDLDDSVLTDPDPEQAIHETDHETVHAMNDQDDIDDDTSWFDGDLSGPFTEDQATELANHIDVGDQARVLDDDGSLGRWGGGGSGAGGAEPDGGSEYQAGSDAPPAEDLTFDIDWASGVWVDSTAADGSYSVDIYFAPMDGW
jgi:hypothetical protein